MSRLAIARFMLCAGIMLVLVSIPLLAGIGPYTVSAGMLMIVAGVMLAPGKG